MYNKMAMDVSIQKSTATLDQGPLDAQDYLIDELFSRLNQLSATLAPVLHQPYPQDNGCAEPKVGGSPLHNRVNANNERLQGIIFALGELNTRVDTSVVR